MKEQILHLDPHDDYTSTRDKMGWVQTQRVLIVWPPHSRVLERRLDLVLVHRHAHRLGAQLALVTRDPRVRANALDLGLPVFDTVEATRRLRWRSHVPRLRPERRQPRPDTVAIRRWLAVRRRRLPTWAGLALRLPPFALGLAALAALAFALVPGAAITLTPASQPVQVSAQILADPNQAAVDSAAAVIPARRVRVEVQDTALTPTTGSVEVPSTVATGRVVFTNLIGTAATVPTGTSLRTTSGTPARFVTLAPASVEGRIGATVEAQVRAVNPGPAGNVSGGQINAIDGPLGTQLAVTNPEPTEGGDVAERAAVTQADRDRLRAELLAELQTSALAAIEAQLQPGEFLASESVTVTQVLAESYDRAVGEPIDAIGLTLRIAAAGLAVSESDGRLAAEAALRAQVPPGAALTDAVITFTRSPDLTLDGAGRVSFAMTAEGRAVPGIDVDAARRSVLRLPVADAISRLQSTLPLATAPEIVLSPGWLARWYPRLPWLWLRIDVVVRRP
jgi:hypothetical protein